MFSFCLLNVWYCIMLIPIKLYIYIVIYIFPFYKEVNYAFLPHKQEMCSE